jgi:hypothetical protein
MSKVFQSTLRWASNEKAWSKIRLPGTQKK